MGAGISQENTETEANNDESGRRNKASQSSETDAKDNHSTTRVSSSQNESKKQTDAPVERSSSKKQQLEQDHNIKKNPIMQKPVAKTESNSVSLSARDLSITWAEDNRFWHWPLLKDSSNETITAAELLNVCWLEVHGRFNTAKLQPGTFYDVVFVVKLKDPAYGWEVPVNVRLTLPGGRKQEHKEILMEKPREKWIEISAGIFETTAENIGEIEFSLYEYEGGKWKKGLVIKGVSFKPTGPFV